MGRTSTTYCFEFAERRCVDDARSLTCVAATILVAIDRAEQLRRVAHELAQSTADEASDRQGLRPRRHRRPPPDAPSRRLLRRAAPVPARRSSSPPTPAPASSTWRPTMARRISCSARRHGIDPVFAVDGRRPLSRRLAVARRPGHRDQHQVQRAGRADLHRPARGRRVCSPPARISSTPIRTAGAPRPRSSSAARRNGSSRWTGRCRVDPVAPAADERCARRLRDAARLALTRSTTRAGCPRNRRTASARWSRGGPTG